MSSFVIHPPHKAWDAADEFMEKAKRRTHGRPIANNTRLVELMNGDYGVKLHSTVIVAYHKDGLQSITLGGWDTITTRQRINQFSVARVGSSGKLYGLPSDYPSSPYTGVHHTSDPTTPARVWKCRTCSGKGLKPFFRYPIYCWPPLVTYTGLHHERCPQPDGHTAPAKVPCLFCGKVETHQEGDTPCWKCKGAGRVDYGSRPIPTPLTGTLLIAPNGQALGKGAISLPIPPTPKYASYHSQWVAGAGTLAPQALLDASKPTFDLSDSIGGGQIVGQLRDAIPDISKYGVLCPVTGCPDARPEVAQNSSVEHLIPHLNDRHEWTREAIADWLETLDLDLKFPAPA